MTASMQAIRIHTYGGPEVLKLEQVDRPEPGANEVLVRVLAAGVNPVDWKVTSGDMRAVWPLQFPNIPGRDIAGIVAAVGPGVTAFQPGQAVFGQSAHGGYAEYVAAAVTTLALKPEQLSFAEAAAIPVGATTAWQSLFDYGHLQAGQTVLIQGAAGGVGIFAVQFAQQKGATVIGTTSSANVAFVQSLGAARVIDYTTTTVEQAIHDADLVFDAVGSATLAASLKATKSGGVLVTIAGQPDAAQAEARGVRVAGFAAQVSHELLTTFAKLAEAGQLKVAIEATYPLASAAQAHEHSQRGHGRGRIVLHIAD